MVLFSGCFGTIFLQRAKIFTAVEQTPVTNYILQTDAPTGDTAYYLYLTGESEFLRYFAMTKSLPGKAFVPDFTRENIVAIILPPTTSATDVQIDTITLKGESMLVHYTLTNSTTAAYVHRPFVVAAVPRKMSAGSTFLLRGRTSTDHSNTYDLLKLSICSKQRLPLRYLPHWFAVVLPRTIL